MASHNFPILQTEKFVLRQFVESDLSAIFKGLSDPEVIQYYGISFKTLEETKEQLQFFADLEANETGIWWAICSLDNQTFYGGGGFNNRSKEHKKAEIGFWLLKDFWGQGIMTEILPLLCQYGFDHLDLHRIEGFVETENFKCKKAMQKLAFNHEGTMKDCEIKDGKFISIDIYALLKNDGVQ
ncbi:GNAT family N-acetyltransferase [Flavobacterium orientale]|uniref:N-acetyltransferase n=1 Tax=Flavobacterium orientale TaxID=1756020 RepID=A0A917DAT5_9FLAO|nr:GNAT family N-acetyltransferase [Flavobacterium orientale]GGD18492.1 N-acetyltransferase [Flavobacterium orientale]